MSLVTVKVRFEGLTETSLRLCRGYLTYNIARTGANPNATIAITSRPTPIQDEAFSLLGLSPNCSQ